jgi:hypothetical protein
MQDPKMVAMLGRLGVDGVNDFLASPDCAMTTWESPAQRWDRLWNKEQFVKPSAEARVDLYLDTATARYTGNGRLTAKMRSQSWEFGGLAHSLAAGQECVLRFDSRNPQLGAVITDQAGRVLGHMAYRPRAQYGDAEAIQAQLGERAAEWSRTLGLLRERHQTGAAGAQQIVELDEKRAVLAPLLDTTTRTADPVPASRDLVRSTGSAKRLTDAELARKQRRTLAAMAELAQQTQEAARNAVPDELEAALDALA